MGYCGPMGYGRKFSANQLGGQLKLWGKRGYGLIQVWVRRGLTVVPYIKYLHRTIVFFFWPVAGVNR